MSEIPKKTENKIIRKQVIPVTVSKNSENDEYRKKLASHKKKNLIRTLVFLLIIVAIAAAVVIFIQRRTYHNYKVLSSSEQEDTSSTKYIELGNNILRYRGDGATLVDKEQQKLWEIDYEMQNPIVDVCDGTAVIADQEGTSMVIVNEGGQTGSVTASYNIVKVRVASQGVVAAILDGGEDTWINFYATDGSMIAENQTRVDDPGYPLDLAVSTDGNLIMVAYQFVEGGQTKSYVAFYNFGTVGQNQVDNIVSGYTYENVVVPQVAYLDSDTAVAFRDDGFSIYKGQQIPKEETNIEVEEEIVSTFYDEDNIGLVFKADEESEYRMEVYSTSGRKKFERNFNIAYTNIRMSNGYIVMNNASQVCVITNQGALRFNGVIDEGAINDFFKVGYNRYMLILDTGIELIKFS